MISMNVKNKIVLPNFNFQEDLVYVAKYIVIPTMAKNINNGVDLNGNKLPDLEPSTLVYKAKNGLSLKTLIATGKLRSSFLYRTVGKSKVVIYLNNTRALIGKYLQIDGVGKKNKHFNFFGISLEMQKNALNYMKKKIQENAKKFSK